MNFLEECWDWDKLSPNDFMVSMSFKISKIKEIPVKGWFKFLNSEEGKFQNVPVSSGREELSIKRLSIGHVSKVYQMGYPTGPKIRFFGLHGLS